MSPLRGVLLMKLLIDAVVCAAYFFVEWDYKQAAMFAGLSYFDAVCLWMAPSD